MKKLVTYLLLIFIINITFLFSPEQKQKGPNALCPHQYLHLNRYMRFPINCDSYIFIGASIKPSYLWKQNFIRQSRPLYIFAGSVSGYLVYFVAYPFRSFIEPYLKNKLSDEYSDKELKKALIYGCFYIGFIIINTIILLVSLILFEKIFRELIPGEKDPVVLLTALFLLVSNQVSKDYFWAAHQQMFNVLSPLLCIYTAFKIAGSSFTFKKIIWLTAGAGLLVLVYGNFLLLLPTIIFCYAYTVRKKTHSVFGIILLVVLFFLPTFTWIFILKLSGINFYSYETDVFRQFVWIYDSLKLGISNLLQQFWENTWAFIQTSGSLIPAIILLLITVLDKKSRRSFPAAKTNPLTSPQVLLFFILIEWLLFLLLLGYYADRLTFSLLPVLLCLFILYAGKGKSPVFVKALCAAVVFSWHVYIMLFNAPHFSEYYFYR